MDRRAYGCTLAVLARGRRWAEPEPARTRARARLAAVLGLDGAELGRVAGQGLGERIKEAEKAGRGEL